MYNSENILNFNQVLLANNINLNEIPEESRRMHFLMLEEFKKFVIEANRRLEERDRRLEERDRRLEERDRRLEEQNIQINEIKNQGQRQFEFFSAQVLEIQRGLNNTNTGLNITNQGLANLGAGLNALDARVTLTEQNLNLLKDRVNTMAEQAIRNGQIPNPVKPREGEEESLKMILFGKLNNISKLIYIN